MLYLAGGEFPDGSASREMWRYDPCFDSWSEMAPMNVARSELGKDHQICINVYNEQVVYAAFHSAPKDGFPKSQSYIIKNFLVNVSRYLVTDLLCSHTF